MIKIYNTLTKKKEKFIPINEGQVNIYICGPTVYNYIHLGNARPIVVFDTVRRYFIHHGYQVKYIQNFTDVDDKIINRASEEGIEPLELSKKYIEEYFKDADNLNIIRADYYPTVSEHIQDIIEFIQSLIGKGYAYESGGDVYFKVRKFREYGKLSGRTLDDMLVGVRVELNENKDDPLDFALWKRAKPSELSWDSPWGGGRPGWHIECSVMSCKYLQNIDIHGGGHDLIFPHHENEIAQSEAALGRPFARYWMHNGFITVNKEKMSKSLGNFFLVRDILKEFSPEVVRFYLLSTHYRSPLDFDDEKLQSVSTGLKRIENCWYMIDEYLDGSNAYENATVVNVDHSELSTIPKLASAKEKFEQAMDDDFNTALAISVWFDLVREVNTLLKNLDMGNKNSGIKELAAYKSLFLMFNRVLGVFKIDETTGKIKLRKKASSTISAAINIKNPLMDGLIEMVVKLRQQARENKEWDTSDRIRDILKDLGITLEDTRQDTKWSADYEKLHDSDIINKLLQILIDLRQEARKNKEWNTADDIRERLKKLGVTLEDTPDGVRWKVL